MKNIINPLEVIKKTKGKFVKVKYQRKDGKVKNYTVRTGVKKGLVGVGKVAPADSITVYSVKGGNLGYKTFLKEGIISIRCGKTRWKIS
jgi:hypothetical protein